MTRPNKHAARFGDRYQPPIDWRRFRDGLQKAQPAINAITAVLRRVSVGLQDRSLIVVPSQTQPGRLAVVPTIAELEWAPATPVGDGLSAGTHMGGGVLDLRDTPEPVSLDRIGEAFREAGWSMFQRTTAPPDDILDRIDDDLLAYDAQRSTGEPWPFESF